MERRYICPACRVKWFIPADHPLHEELTECAACKGPLVALLGTGENDFTPQQLAPPPDQSASATA